MGRGAATAVAVPLTVRYKKDMSTQAARVAYTRWLLADTRYQQARRRDLENPVAGMQKAVRAEELAAYAKRTKDAFDIYQFELQQAAAPVGDADCV